MAKPHRKLPILTTQEIEQFWSKVDRVPGQGPKGECWQWKAGTDMDGYGLVKIQGRSSWKVHRIAFMLQSGADPGERLVCHTCDNPPCCRGAHLFTGTNADNVADMKAKGRMVFRGQPRRSSGRIPKGKLNPAISAQCMRCGSGFKMHVSRIKKYCSQACYDIARAAALATCQKCGKTIRAKGQRQFCNNQCRYS